MKILNSTTENNESLQKRLKHYASNACSKKTIKKRLPILQWLPRYNVNYLIQDIIAGITVGLTAIPQGIAYAVIAGLSPEYGLYASLTCGFVYVVFGSCKDVTVGPTAIQAALVAKYVSDYSADFAILAAFISGLVQLVLGLLHLGFLVDFISEPVISGFTTAAALQIAAAQLKSFFGLTGPGGHNFTESVANFVKNIKTAKLWDPILATITIIMLILLKILGKGTKRTGGFIMSMKWFMAMARNAVVVIIGMIIAYFLKITIASEPLALVGDIGKGLPPITLPPFSTVVENRTLSFTEMVSVLGAQSLIIPFVAILESIAISKAFSGGKPIDATQELIALGLCNMIGSCAGSMPITGSFTRTAVNHASGVQTQAGGVSKCLLLIFALAVMADAFYFIPKASLSGLILVAMYYMIDFAIFARLWKTNKKELFSMVVTLIVCLHYGLEYGIIVGILLDAVMLLYSAARPNLKVNALLNETGNAIVIELTNNLSYCAAEHIRKNIVRSFSAAKHDTSVILDGRNLDHMDSTVASSILSVVIEMELRVKQIMFINFNENVKNMCLVTNKDSDRFFTGSNVIMIDCDNHL
ncbi:sulfate permease family domain-containing protein [Phthorimaea operculella]|nr:sulfate permease family domain-containing protein [Phthorimaea operculella]